MATYSTFKEDLNCDLAIENGDFAIVEDNEFIAQQLGTDYRLSKRNWFLDLGEGTDYINGDDGIIGARSITPQIEQAFLLVADNGVGVRDVKSITFELSSAPESEFTVKPTVVSEFSDEEMAIEVNI